MRANYNNSTASRNGQAIYTIAGLTQPRASKYDDGTYRSLLLKDSTGKEQWKSVKSHHPQFYEFDRDLRVSYDEGREPKILLVDETRSQAYGLEPPSRPAYEAEMQKLHEQARTQPDVREIGNALLSNIAVELLDCVYAIEASAPDGYSAEQRKALAISLFIEYRKTKREQEPGF